MSQRICFPIAVGYNGVVWRNGAKLCGDATWQGPVQFERARPSVRSERIRPLPADAGRGRSFGFPGTPELCLKNPRGRAAFLQRPYVNVRTSAMNLNYRIPLLNLAAKTRKFRGFISYDFGSLLLCTALVDNASTASAFQFPAIRSKCSKLSFRDL